MTRPDPRSTEVARPSKCPFCNGLVIDTLAKVITADTTWRCLSCEKTWSIARLMPPPARR